jgi:quercetin dioxygenase-like cupin family protein
MKRVVVVLALALGVTSSARAQDAVTSNPKVYHVMLENAAVRVLHVAVAPGAKTVMHEHPDNAVLVLTDSKIRFTGPDGKSQEPELKANEAMWSPAGKHMGENIGTGPIEAIIVELKGKNAPSATIPASRPNVAITQLFDNPRARAVRATMDPAFHEEPGTMHDYDQVVIALGSSDIWRKVADNKPKTQWKRGDAEFIGRGVKHESKNAGQKPVDLFILAIK